jgi:hypothetical protein
MTITIESTLPVQRIKQPDYPSKIKLVKSWSSLAFTKSNSEETNRDVLYDCHNVCDFIAKRFSYPTYYNFEAYACKDDQGADQGFMLINIGLNKITLLYIVTSPDNILNNKRGTGTALIYLAIQRCLEENKDHIVVEGIDSARPFYERHGFEEVDIATDDADYVMKLSAEKIRRSLSPGLKKAA